MEVTPMSLTRRGFAKAAAGVAIGAYLGHDPRFKSYAGQSQQEQMDLG